MQRSFEPTLQTRLDELRREFVSGRGLGLIRGIPVADLPARQSAAMFFGLGSHIGVARSQNAAGHLLGHVRDVGLDAADPDVRIYQTDQRRTFHTDSADVVALLCLETAQSGRIVEAPRLTDAQTAASDLFDDIANDDRFNLEMRLEPGDMQFVHNRSLLHDRTAFVNKPEAPRHLLRLWLSV